MAARSTIRVAACSAVMAATTILGASAAAAASGHTSCRDLGALTAAEGKAHLVAAEITAFAPGGVDDLIALVQLGGTFDGEVVPPACSPK